MVIHEVGLKVRSLNFEISAFSLDADCSVSLTIASIRVERAISRNLKITTCFLWLRTIIQSLYMVRTMVKLLMLRDPFQFKVMVLTLQLGNPPKNESSSRPHFFWSSRTQQNQSQWTKPDCLKWGLSQKHWRRTVQLSWDAAPWSRTPKKRTKMLCESRYRRIVRKLYFRFKMESGSGGTCL